MIESHILSLLFSAQQLVPFGAINHAQLLPAFEEGDRRARARIAQITDNPAPATFKNTIEALEFADEEAGRLAPFHSVFTGNLMDERFQNEDLPKLSKLMSDYQAFCLANKELFARVRAVYDHETQLKRAGQSKLNQEEWKLLEDKYQELAKEGALLPADKQQRLAELRKAIKNAGNEYRKNLAHDNDAFGVWVTDAARLSGLPDDVVAAAKKAAAKKDPARADHWFVSIKQAGDVFSLADDEMLRKETLEQHFRVGQTLERNNLVLAKQIALLRHEVARLLGFAHHAEYQLSDRMLKEVSSVEKFIEDIRLRAIPVAKKETEELRQFVIALEGDDKKLMQPWNRSYYAEKLKKAKYQFDEQELRPYFQLDKMLASLNELSHDVYGIRIEEVHGAKTFHPDVKLLRVTDEDGSLLGHIYADFFKRDGKSMGAWQSNFRNQGLYEDGTVNERPILGLTANYTKPEGDKPVLLVPAEVVTLYHEFGHALHNLFSQVRYKSLSGTSVAWDFVELPSKLHERWVMTPEFLQRFALHYQTGESLPAALVERLLASENFWSASDLLVTLELTRLDLRWHSQDPANIQDIKAFEVENRQDFRVTNWPVLPSLMRSSRYSHIFPGAYSMGYYSYTWADVLAADGKEGAIEAGGVFHRGTAQRCRELMSKGGTVDPAELFRRYRGRNPDPAAFLREKGI